MEKKQIRQELLKQRRQLSSVQIEASGIEFLNRLHIEPIFESAQSLFLYMAMQEEIPTLPLIEAALFQGKKVFLPRVIDKTQMAFYPFKSLADLEQSKFGVLEPPATQAVTPEQVEQPLMIIPALSYSEAGYRLGYGAGYYDRYLEKHTVKSIGVCYEFQRNEAWKPEDHDKKVDHVIYIHTDK